MFDQSPRKDSGAISQTPNNVGPNTYFFCNTDNKINPVAFLSTEKRTGGQKLPSYTEAIENIQVEKNHLGGTSPRNREKRFRIRENENPGPADYFPGAPYEKYAKIGKGKIFLCRVPYTLKGSGPSIPTHCDENGYDIDTDNNLIKNPPDYHDTSIGPAFYKISEEQSTSSTKKYDNWSLSKSKRMQFGGKNSPAPNTYNVNTKFCQCKEQDVKTREMIRFFGFNPRYAEAEQIRKIREDFPGPGAHNINNSPFRFIPPKSVIPVPMISQENRFKSFLSTNPAPGEYEICDCSTKHQYFSTSFAPFLTKSERTTGNMVDLDSPGPNTYCISSLKEKKNKYSWAAFTFAAERKIGLAKDDSECMPSPNQYDLNIKGKEEKVDVTNSPFKSTSRRLPKIKENDDPSAASYNVTPQFNKLRNKCYHNRGKVPFGSSAQRVEKIQTTPGPADYLSQNIMGTKGRSFPIDNRFRQIVRDLPGPGQYSIHYKVGNALAKAYTSHNMYLSNNVKRTKISCPNETYSIWTNMIRKKKKLLWFASHPSST